MLQMVKMAQMIPHILSKHLTRKFRFSQPFRALLQRAGQLIFFMRFLVPVPGRGGWGHNVVLYPVHSTSNRRSKSQVRVRIRARQAAFHARAFPRSQHSKGARAVIASPRRGRWGPTPLHQPFVGIHGGQVHGKQLGRVQHPTTQKVDKNS